MSPAPLLNLPADHVPEDLYRQVHDALEAGQLVALPTETVYGLAARADRPDALARLCEAKGRAPSAPFTWHAGSAESALAAAPALGGMISRLAETFWPGPLTLVVRAAPEGLGEVAQEGWIGVRVPAHGGTRALLERLPFPVVASSANSAGAPPLTDAAAVAAQFGDQVAYVLDGGPADLARSSTVARVGPGAFEVLREGTIDAEELRRTAGRRLLFVCTGNTCRSPMAEALARDLLARHLDVPDPEAFGFQVNSAGVFAGRGSPASSHAVAVLSERSVDLSQHRSSPIRDEVLADATHIYCLTASHGEWILPQLQPGESKRVTLLDPGGDDILDPIGADRSIYRKCADAILHSLDARLKDWV